MTTKRAAPLTDRILSGIISACAAAASGDHEDAGLSDDAAGEDEFAAIQEALEWAIDLRDRRAAIKLARKR